MAEVIEEVSVLRSAAARSLLTLAREHKATCADPDCTVTLMSLRPVYAALLQRPPTDEEWAAFL